MTSTTSDSARHSVLRLRATITDVLGSVLPAGVRRVALLDFPNHANVGDSAIWLGELAYCTQQRLDIVYRCDFKTYSRQRLLQSLGDDGVIFLHGGGNFGDLWRHHQEFRERVIADFPEVPIIQLPQSIHFQDPALLAQTQRALATHRSFTLLARDHRSRELAGQHFGLASPLCPDMAFCLGELPRPTAPHLEQLWLWRTDIEAGAGAEAAYRFGDDQTSVVDWLTEPASLLKRLNRKMSRKLMHAGGSDLVAGLTERTLRPLAQRRLDRGCRLLSSGRVVVTNRLHAHILSLLMGIPHVIIDNSYGKVRGYAETWGLLSDAVVASGDVDDARRQAAVLLSRLDVQARP